MATSLELDASDVVHDSAGNVRQLRQNWAVHEDGALAHRLQSQEIESHLKGNKLRNHQIREDFPTALAEQNLEVSEAERQYQEYLLKQRSVEAHDAEIARKMAQDLDAVDLEHQRYEAARDEAFAKRLQAMEQRKQGQPRRNMMPLPVPRDQISVPLPHISAKAKGVTRPDPQGTPPLPVLSNGDVLPNMGGHEDETSFHDLRGGLKYNDEQYLVKTAMPAVIKAEPLYANNKPEHYAVSKPLSSNLGSDGAHGGAVGGASKGDYSPELFEAAGLSQRDVALSKRVEEQLAQERRDRELARQLQQELSLEEDESNSKAALEAKDFEYARHLHEKEKAKLQRAKERSRLKKQQQREQEQCKQSPPNAAQGSPESQQGSHQESRTNSRMSNKSKSSQELYSVPVRKPYMNPDAIDTHVSSCGEETEPYYENVQKKQNEIVMDGGYVRISGSASVHDGPVPPYMPMQQSNSKKTSSLEKRILKKKEKEGCKQQ